MTIDIFLFRHGQTDWNRDLRWQGQIDIPLNELGRNQARALIPVLRSLKIDGFFSSDLCRAKECADIIAAEINLPVMLESRFRELAFGEAEGLTMAQIEASFGAEQLARARSMAKDDWDFKFPGGESKKELSQRCLLACQDIAKNLPELKRIAVATHGGLIRAFFQLNGEFPTKSVLVENGALFHFTYSSQDRQLSFQGRLNQTLTT